MAENKRKKKVSSVWGGVRFLLTPNWRAEDQVALGSDHIDVPSDRVVALVGCNGIGKTTILEQIAQALKADGVLDASDSKEYNPLEGMFRNLGKREETKRAKDPTGFLITFDKVKSYIPASSKKDARSWLEASEMNRLFSGMSSNGESVIRRLNSAIAAIGHFVEKAQLARTPVYILIDDADAGTSVDVIAELRDALIELSARLRELRIPHLIIVSANSYEFVRSGDVTPIVVPTLKTVKGGFPTYESFREAIAQTRKGKEARDAAFLKPKGKEEGSL